MSILGAIGLGTSLIGGIMGASQASKARREQQRAIRQEQAAKEGWYNRNYYQNYVDSTEAQSAMTRMRDTLRRRSEENRAAAAIAGATQEAAVAQQANDSQAVAQAMQGIAEKGDAIKRQTDAQYMGYQTALNGQRMQQAQLDEQGGNQLLGNSVGLIGSALSMFDKNKK